MRNDNTGLIYMIRIKITRAGNMVNMKLSNWKKELQTLHTITRWSLSKLWCGSLHLKSMRYTYLSQCCIFGVYSEYEVVIGVTQVGTCRVRSALYSTYCRALHHRSYVLYMFLDGCRLGLWQMECTKESQEGSVPPTHPMPPLLLQSTASSCQLHLAAPRPTPARPQQCRPGLRPVYVHFNSQLAFAWCVCTAPMGHNGDELNAIDIGKIQMGGIGGMDQSLA